ncbi:YqgE/AlgH family protein [Xinfangfangia pollutisoli]|uniref:YqgE/AlgH family protein n=1 Tax=Xinfangfangia pollutisoli TaxID=2865960 RepID=UPI0021E5CC2F
MPGMGDPRFARSVILMCAHDSESAMGLIVNKPAPDLNFGGLLDHLGISRGDRGREIRVHYGGPVDKGRGFVLHTPDWGGEAATMRVPGGFRVTATLDVLEDLARGAGPDQALLALGYAGWGPGQLEGEILRNDWLVAEALPEIVFAASDAEKWTLALKALGVDPLTLSPSAGRA